MRRLRLEPLSGEPADVGANGGEDIRHDFHTGGGDWPRGEIARWLLDPFASSTFGPAVKLSATTGRSAGG